jgi:anti-sigma B factor antagonist
MISTDLSMCACEDHVVVTLRGELDLIDAAYVAATLAAVADHRPAIVVDLTGLEFIDLSGVKALARGRRQARKAGGDLVLALPQPQAMRLVAGAARAYDFSVHATVEEALSSIASASGLAGTQRCVSRQ